MTEFISNLIGNNYVATLLMSFIPLIELKGGIVFGWDLMFPLWAFLLAFAGSSFVFFPVFFLLKPLLNGLKKIKGFNKLVLKVEGYFEQKANESMKKQNGKKHLSATAKKMLAVFVFIGIPLPMTGIWAGTAIAVFLGLKFKEAILPALAGNLVAGGLICGLSALCNLIGVNLDYVLYGLFGLAVILSVVIIVKVITQKTSTDEQNIQQNSSEVANESEVKE